MTNEFIHNKIMLDNSLFELKNTIKVSIMLLHNIIITQTHVLSMREKILTLLLFWLFC